MRGQRVLGKGLSALIQGADLGGRLGDREVRLLPIEAVGLNPHQPRKSFKEDGLRELAASVGQVGVLQPVLVRRLKDGESPVLAHLAGEEGTAAAAAPDAAPSYCLVAGERRLRAARLAGVREIPAIVCTYEETEALKIALLENIQREDLDPIDEASAYRDLLERLGATQEELAAMLGKNRSSVANSLRLLALAPEIQQMLRAGEISRGHAKALLGLGDAEARLRLARLCRSRGLSVRECEHRVLLQGASPRRAARKRRREQASAEESLEVRALRERAERELGAPVTIQRNAADGRGSLIIRFFSDSDLERILAFMGIDTDLS